MELGLAKLIPKLGKKPTKNNISISRLFDMLRKPKLNLSEEKITRNYDHYIKKEMMANDSVPGEDKIINIVRIEDIF